MFLRDRFSVQPSSQYILRTCQESSPAMGCDHTTMPTTHRFMVTVLSTMSQGFPRWSRRACFMMLQQARAVALYLLLFAIKTLVTSLVLSKLDYCNSVLVGLPKTLTHHSQSVFNAAARLVMRKHKYDHITPILSELQWLGIERRIEFKVALLLFKCLKEMAPPYLASKVTRLRDLPSRKRLRSSSSSLLFVPARQLKCTGDRSFTVAGPRIWN